MPDRLKTTLPKPPAQAVPVSHISLRGLAQHLGLSSTTVSRVVNRSPGAKAIPAATQERILQAAKQLHYRPNIMAQSLRKQRSYTIGVMVPEVSEGYAALVLKGLEDYLLGEGYFYFVVSHRHRAELLEEYPRLLVARAVEGIVAVDTPLDHALSVPVVTISGHHKVDGQTNIVLNHRRAATLALEHLAGLGHRQIAVLMGQSFSSDTATRWNAIRYAAKQLQIRLDPQLVVQLQTDSPTSEPGYRATQELLRTPASFTAIFAFNDVSAIGSIRAIREAGLRVPEDVSVVGFDDIPSAAFQHPALTTVRQPLQTMGMLSVQHLLECIKMRQGRGKHSKSKQTNPPHKLIVVEPELIVRNSTAQMNPRLERSI